MSKPLVGLALGSGSVRGWSHIGVIQGLAELGVEPDIVCGSSIGALVGAAYANGVLDQLEKLARRLNRVEMARLVDLIGARGGMIEGSRFMAAIRDFFGDGLIEELPIPFLAVACDFVTGREVWLREGSLLEAIRASVAIPGLVVPGRIGGRLLVDGGLVNPVPVSPCRALGADIVIAVNVNGELVSRRRGRDQATAARQDRIDARAAWGGKLLSEISAGLGAAALGKLWKAEDGQPDIFDVVLGSLDIMQTRIMQSRLAGDPPDMLLAPRLKGIGLLDLSRAGEAIEEGRDCVKEMGPALREMVERHG